VANICVFCASSNTIDQRWLDLATRTGAELAQGGHARSDAGFVRRAALDPLVLVDSVPAALDAVEARLA